LGPMRNVPPSCKRNVRCLVRRFAIAPTDTVKGAKRATRHPIGWQSVPPCCRRSHLASVRLRQENSGG
jgi:hypothetical protein